MDYWTLQPAVVEGYGYGVAFFSACALVGVALLVRSVPKLRRGQESARQANRVLILTGVLLVGGSLAMIIAGYFNVTPPG